MRAGCYKTLLLSLTCLSLLILLWTDAVDAKDKVEYVKLPLLTFEENTPPPPSTSRFIPIRPNSVKFLPDLLPLTNNGEGRQNNNFKRVNSETVRSVNGGGEDTLASVINQLTDFVNDDEDDGNIDLNDDEENLEKEEEEYAINGGVENGDDNEDEEPDFTELDLIDLVQELERQADEEEQTGIFPELLEILHGRVEEKKGNNNNSGLLVINPTRATMLKQTSNSTLTISDDNDSHLPRNGSFRIYMNEDGDLQLGSEDLSEFSDEIVDGISEGVEESLRMSDDLELEGFNLTNGSNGTEETRQFSVYLFQGQYYAEPRLNRFIDGALRNMGTELRVASMDPLYFRVLPKGQVAERERPLMAASGGGVAVNNVRRRRPAVRGGGDAVAVGRQLQLKLPAFFRPNANHNQKNNEVNQQQQVLRQQLLQQPLQGQKVVGVAGQGQQHQQLTRITSIAGRNIFLRRNRQRQRQRRRRQRIRQQQQRLKNKRKKQQQKQQQIQRQKNQKKKQQILLQRIRRRIKQDVGGGRIEGLSRVQRDGDAEMQLFGNYTLIRSHMKYGPIEITMQFRTKNGIRRSGATLPTVRAHTVTRVNHEGSEMIDFLLDRPTPEMIRVRGTLFPMAQRIARSIFARLFLPNSFLTAKLREKAHLAYLSKPVISRRKR